MENWMNARRLLPALVVGCACIGLSGASAPASDAARSSGSATLKVESLRVGTKASPLTLRVRAGIAADVTLWVNGRRVKQPFEMVGKRSQQIELRATDGLRTGANKLRMRTVRGGVVHTAKRTAQVPRWALLANAGADAAAVVHARSRLGAKPALGASRSAVSHSWRIVKRPLGSRVALRARDNPRSILHARTPGTYILQLEANPDGSGPSAYDQVTVTVNPPDPPIGAPIETIDAKSGAISIDGDSYGGGAISYVVLARATREPATVPGPDPSKPVAVAGSVQADAAGIARLAELAQTYGAASGSGNYMKYLMIVSGRTGLPKAQAEPFATLVKDLGADHLTTENFSSLAAGQEFSVIGIPGAPGGAATIRIPAVYTPKISGAIRGFLQKSAGTNPGKDPYYEYVASERPHFDTRAAGSTDRVNKMLLDGKTLTGTLPDDASAGFHLVVLESLTLRVLDERVLKTNGTGNNRDTQRRAGEDLAQAIVRAGGPIVLLQTIGKPKAAGPEWGRVVNALGGLGVNRQYVNALDGTTEYALVARLGGDAPPAEASTAYDHGYYPAPNYPPARLVGVLARARTSAFEPNMSATPTAKNPTGAINLALIDIAYQPSKPWPPLGPGAKKPGEATAAQTYICKRMGFCQPVSSCPNLRDCFWERFTSNWTLKAGELRTLEFPKDPTAFEGTKVEPEVFVEVRDQLAKEAGAVADVQFFLDQLQKPFDLSVAGSHLQFDKIADGIWNSLPRPATDNSTAWTLGLIGKVINVGVFAGPPISIGAAGLAASFGLASYLSDKKGQPIFASPVKSRAQELGTELIARVNLARRTMATLGELIVSDSGKLKAAKEMIDSDWGKVDPARMVEPLEDASKQWFYEALIPTAYPYLIRGNAGNARFFDCRLRDAIAWPNQPDTYQMGATSGYDEAGNPIRDIFFFTRGIGGGSSPSAAIGDEMFRPQEGVPNPGLGIEKLSFFTPRLFGGKIAHAVNGAGQCQLGWLPALY
jgi:hypothetical protein